MNWVQTIRLIEASNPIALCLWSPLEAYNSNQIPLKVIIYVEQLRPWGIYLSDSLSGLDKLILRKDLPDVTSVYALEHSEL